MEDGITSETSYKVNVKKRIASLSKIEITAKPKTEYFVDEEINLTGTVVMATYSDGAKAFVTGWKASGYDKTKMGEQEIFVTYTEGDVTKETSYKVNVGAVPFEIKITEKPIKTEYYVGDGLDLTGLEVKALYDDGTEKDVTDKVTVSGFDSSKEAESQEITVTYGGKTTSFTVKIKPLLVEKIEITKEPLKKIYYTGDKLDLEGLEVKVKCNNGIEKDVTDKITVSGFDSSKDAKSQEITVSYDGKTATFIVRIIGTVLMSVEEFIKSLGNKVETITYDTTQDMELILSADGKTANVCGVKLSGKFSSGNTFPSTLKKADLRGLDTSSVTDMSDMFSGCASLESINLSGFDTSSVIGMTGMFHNCGSLESIDLSGFDTSSVTDMSYMFRGCASLKSIDLSCFDTSSVWDMSNMFSCCTSLESIDLSSFDTSSVEDTESMFYGCGTAEKPLDVKLGKGWTLGTDSNLGGAINVYIHE